MDPSLTPSLTIGSVAADLRRVADLFDRNPHLTLDAPGWVHLDIQPGGPDGVMVARTNAVAALFGGQARAQQMGGGTWHYDFEAVVGDVQVHLFDSISEASVRDMVRSRELAEKEAEIARLLAEVEQLRVAAASTKPHPSWPTEAELKPWESLASAADRIAESMVPAPEPEGETEAVTIAEHEISTAWKGDDPGQCGAQCRCGVTYDGFDTLAEASEFLARHIADPTGQDYGRADTAVADDPTPVSGGRIQSHTGEMVGTTRDGRLVDADAPEVERTEICPKCSQPIPAEQLDEHLLVGHAPEPEGRVIGRATVELGPDPNAACAAHDDAHLGEPCPDRTILVDETEAPVHFVFVAGDTPCGLDAEYGDLKTTSDQDAVTCPACLDALIRASA